MPTKRLPKRAVTSNRGRKRKVKAPAPMTSAERQAALKARRAELGLVQCNMWVPASAVPELQRAAELMRENTDLTVARLVNRRTGKLRGLK